MTTVGAGTVKASATLGTTTFAEVARLDTSSSVKDGPTAKKGHERVEIVVPVRDDSFEPLPVMSWTGVVVAVASSTMWRTQPGTVHHIA